MDPLLTATGTCADATTSPLGTCSGIAVSKSVVGPTRGRSSATATIAVGRDRGESGGGTSDDGGALR